MIRRVNIIACIIIFFTCNLAEGQKFHGGITGGFNGSQVDGDTYAGYNKIGLVLGAYTNTQINDKVSAELQIRYSQKGANKKVSENDLSQYKSKLNYIELPVLINYSTSKKISWHVGPSFGYLFNFKVEDENGPLNDDAINFRSFDLSALAGMKYRVAGKLAVSLTFSYSLIPIADHPNDPIHFRQPGLYNNVITVLLSYGL